MFQPKPDAEEGKRMFVGNLTWMGVGIVILRLSPYIIFFVREQWKLNYPGKK